MRRRSAEQWAVTGASVIFALGLLPVVGAGVARAGTTKRVSVASDGTQGNNPSYYPFISADGRFVVFSSNASNLVPGDANGLHDIFVHDRITGHTTRVSVASGGAEANDWSCDPSISADGRFVAFVSLAGNLADGDTNGKHDVFVHDRQAGQTARVSVADDGAQGDDNSYGPSVSGDGRFVAFHSEAGNLLPDDTNGATDVFVHDRQTGYTSRVSVASDGAQGNGWSSDPSISSDGRFVAFTSSAGNLADGDTNGSDDVFVHDRHTGQTARVSVASDGAQGNNDSYWACVSADGRFVAFASSAGNLVEGDTNGAADVFVHDRQAGHTTRVSVASDGTQGNDGSYCPSISADGRFMAFDSYADNLVDGDTNGGWDVFLHDRQTGLTARVSVASDGGEGNAGSYGPCISADGRLIAFVSAAGNLVAGDTNGRTDVFVHDRSGLFLLADVNDDCVVNILDLIAVRNGLNGDVSEGENAKLDVNRDGVINILDMIFVRNSLTTTCER